MVIGRGPLYTAYVLSNYGTALPGTSQHLFAFDPRSFSTLPIWAKKTLTSGGDDYGHLGLTFGRGESFLYAFSWYNSKATLSLLDLNGDSKWQYSTPDGSSSKSNLIQYKNMGADLDMVIATSGGIYINYNVVISSSVSPYSISTDSKTYRDPSPSTSR